MFYRALLAWLAYLALLVILAPSSLSALSSAGGTAIDNSKFRHAGTVTLTVQSFVMEQCLSISGTVSA